MEFSSASHHHLPLRRDRWGDSQYDTALVADSAGACAGGSIFCKVPKAYCVDMTDLAYWIGGKGYAY